MWTRITPNTDTFHAVKTKDKHKSKKLKIIKKKLDNINAHSCENDLLVPKEEEIFNNIYNELIDKIEELTKNINSDDLKFIIQITGQETYFIKLKDHITFLNYIKIGGIKL